MLGGGVTFAYYGHHTFPLLLWLVRQQTNKQVDMAPLHSNSAPCHNCAIYTAAFASQSLAMLWERCTDIGCWSVSNRLLVSLTQVKALITVSLSDICRQYECLSNTAFTGMRLQTAYKT